MALRGGALQLIATWLRCNPSITSVVWREDDTGLVTCPSDADASHSGSFEMSGANDNSHTILSRLHSDATVCNICRVRAASDHDNAMSYQGSLVQNDHQCHQKPVSSCHTTPCCAHAHTVAVLLLRESSVQHGTVPRKRQLEAAAAPSRLQVASKPITLD